MSTQSIPQVHVQMTQWQDKHELNATARNNLVDNYQAQYENGEISQEECKIAQGCVWDIYEEKTVELGLGYDFMDGKDSSDTQAYQTQLGALAQGEMALKDRNGDGQISRTEYILGEVYSGSTVLSLEEKVKAATEAHMAFDAINALVLTNSNPDDDTIDDNLNLGDFENFYKALDGFNYNEDFSKMSFDGNFNGEIALDSFAEFMNTATAGVTEQQEAELASFYESVYKLAPEIKITAPES